MCGSLLFIILLVHFCVCCINITTKLDKNERLNNDRNITNPAYEYTNKNTEIILIANDNYCEI